jgi:hypothetical protein
VANRVYQLKVYGYVVYQRRVTKIRKRDPGNFGENGTNSFSVSFSYVWVDELWGPVVISALLFVAVATNFSIRRVYLGVDSCDTITDLFPIYLISKRVVGLFIHYAFDHTKTSYLVKNSGIYRLNPEFPHQKGKSWTKYNMATHTIPGNGQFFAFHGDSRK